MAKNSPQTYANHGRVDPRISTVAQFFIAQDDGAVPRLPMRPAVNGGSSGRTALPSSALVTGAPSRSGSLRNLIADVQRALPGQDGRSSAAVQNICGGLELIRRGLCDRRHPG